MQEILVKFASIYNTFQPRSTEEVASLYLAHKLDDAANARYYTPLVYRYPAWAFHIALNKVQEQKHIRGRRVDLLLAELEKISDREVYGR